MSIRSWSVAVLLVALVCAVCAPGAIADVDMYVPNALTESPPLDASPSTGAVTPLATGSGRYCNAPYVTVAGQWNSFAIGSCLQGNTFVQSGYKDLSSNGWGTWAGGFFGGSFGGCGWVNTAYAPLNGGTGSASCDPNYARPQSEYMATASTPSGYAIWQSTSSAGEDGVQVSVANPAGCTEYANLRPWSSAGGPANAVGTAPSYLWVRYQTKYQYNGKTWYMVHDHNRAAGQGSWVFVANNDCGMSLPAPNR